MEGHDGQHSTNLLASSCVQVRMNTNLLHKKGREAPCKGDSASAGEKPLATRCWSDRDRCRSGPQVVATAIVDEVMACGESQASN